MVGAKADAVITEKSPRERVPPFGDATRGHGRDDIWILEDWEGNSGAKVRIPLPL